MTTKILLEDIRIFAYHGVLPEEKIIGTFYIVNAEITADFSRATESDLLEDTINYALVNDIIHEEMEIPSILLERVIGRIISRLEATFPQITAVKIKLTKTSPPMPGEMRGVSVEVEKKIA